MLVHLGSRTLSLLPRVAPASEPSRLVPLHISMPHPSLSLLGRLMSLAQDHQLQYLTSSKGWIPLRDHRIGQCCCQADQASCTVWDGSLAYTLSYFTPLMLLHVLMFHPPHVTTRSYVSPPSKTSGGSLGSTASFGSPDALGRAEQRFVTLPVGCCLHKDAQTHKFYT